MQIKLAAAMLVTIGWLAGCEGVTTGTEVARVSLQVGSDGAYAPVRFNLGYELTITPVKPVAITLSNVQADARRNVQRPPQ